MRSCPQDKNKNKNRREGRRWAERRPGSGGLGQLTGTNPAHSPVVRRWHKCRTLTHFEMSSVINHRWNGKLRGMCWLVAHSTLILKPWHHLWVFAVEGLRCHALSLAFFRLHSVSADLLLSWRCSPALACVSKELFGCVWLFTGLLYLD